MNPKIIFKLHEPQHDIDVEHQKDTYVYMFFSFGYFENFPINENKKKYVPLKYSTGLSIKPCFWEDRPYYRAKKSSFESVDHFNTRLDYLQDSIFKVFGEFETCGLRPTPAQLRERFDAFVNNELKKPVLSLNDFISIYIKDARNGDRLTSKKKKYRITSIKNLIGFQVQFSNYQKGISRKLNFEQINRQFLTNFIQYFKEKNYSLNTISRHVKHLRMFMRSAREEGLHNNFEIDHRRFRVSQQEVDQIFLKENELESLLDLDLSKKPKLEIVRDVFLIGCYIAQRYSDYKTINKKQIIQLDNKRIAVEIFQSKTGKRTIIPLREEAASLLKKYDFNLPYTYEQLMNTKIQEIAKMAGLEDLTKSYLIVNSRRVKIKIPRYKLIKTHTARRSGCTNMYLANIPINEIMAISGHQTVYDFMKYIRASNIQIAKKLSVYPYFAGN